MDCKEEKCKLICKTEFDGYLTYCDSHRLIMPIMCCFSSIFNSTPFGISCHFARHPRQQVAALVLRYENRMVAPRGLFSVIGGFGGRKALFNKICGVIENCFQTFSAQYSDSFFPSFMSRRNSEVCKLSKTSCTSFIKRF